ncbi:hypothetical protein DEHRE_06085 [Dehalobacter restrictus DSM 9455]|jgi:hypothetical protein|uniref:Uncharacterized protein n=1 Tax=Dehalobacter restrictus (strain DSM 9455 / PER-K23) TaxID=871738 RepID=A0ABN4C0A9_DEHRP|nr:hypothetical protein DEHRE_06085 [Dehalobacter restrictus DSM 9455]
MNNTASCYFYLVREDLYESQLSELEIIGLEKADKIYQNVER